MMVAYPVAPSRSGGIKDATGQVHHVQVLVDSANAMREVLQRILEIDGDEATLADEIRAALGEAKR